MTPNACLFPLHLQASMHESLIGSLQQRLVQARQERDQEVRESDALFSQLQEHMRAKQVGCHSDRAGATLPPCSI